MKGFEEQEYGEKGHKFGRKVVLKDSKGQTGLSDSVPRTIQKVFEFGCAETTKEYFPHKFSKEDDKDKGLNINDGHTRIGLGDINNRGVKLLPLKVGIAYDYSCE